jgi:hypothetical protein
MSPRSALHLARRQPPEPRPVIRNRRRIGRNRAWGAIGYGVVLATGISFGHVIGANAAEPPKQPVVAVSTVVELEPETKTTRIAAGQTATATTVATKPGSSPTGAGFVTAGKPEQSTTTIKGAVVADGSGPTTPTTTPITAAPIVSSGNTAVSSSASADQVRAAVLTNARITLSDQARQDLVANVVDARIVLVINELSKKHTIEVNVLRSGHSKYVKRSSRISNHHVGRGMDIRAVDDQLVSSRNDNAKTAVEEMLNYDTAFRPTELGSPWNTDDPETFTDSGHRDHLHVGFDY